MKENRQEGLVIAVSVSMKKGTKKKNVEFVELKENFGIIGDIHAGTENRQVSFLAKESIDKIKAKGLNVKPGDFAENVTTEGIELVKLGLGSKIKVGENAFLEISQIGKVCHTKCAIYHKAGDCVMPKEGIFARVLKKGIIKPGDKLEVVK